MPHPTSDSAYGIWSLNEVRDAVRGDNWPELPSDPNFADVSLLINADGEADGSTNIVDASNNANTITVNGNAQIDTSIFKYGTGAIEFDGTGDNIKIPKNEIHNFGSGAFTIEFWVNFSVNDNAVIVARIDSSGNGDWSFFYNASLNKWRVVHTSNTIIEMSNTWTPSIDTWYHVAVSRSGNNFYFFIDGIQQGTTQTHSVTFPFTSTDPTTIGSFDDDSNFFNGYIDDLRITTGVARYTANFTPPTEAFPTR